MPVPTSMATLEQVAANLTVADLIPHLTERGMVEVRGGLDRLQLAALERDVAALRSRVAELEAAAEAPT